MAHPVRWVVLYPARPSPIGWISHRRDGYHAWFGHQPLGVYPTGDAAAEAVWARFLEQSSVRHEVASRTHGSRERHPGGPARP